jgi:hypothetical protein
MSATELATVNRHGRHDALMTRRDHSMLLAST